MAPRDITDITPEEETAFWDYIGGGKTGGANASLYNSVVGMLGNPVFLLQQGLITPEMLVDNIKLSTADPIDTSAFDYGALEDSAAGVDLLTTAYGLIKQGFSVGSALRAMYGEAAGAAGKASDVAKFNIDSIESDLTAFKSAWDAANDVADKITSGEYFERGGVVYKPKPLDEAQGVLAAMGLPKYLQNPLMFEVIPDPELLAKAVAGDREAATITEELGRMVTPEGVYASPAARKAANAATQKAGESAYRSFLEKSPSGQEIIAGKGALPKDLKVTQSNLAKLLREGKIENVRVPQPKTADKQGFKELYASQAYKDYIKGKESGEIKKVPDLESYYRVTSPVSNKSAQQADYWAKMAGSYAARAASDEARKPITDLQKASAAAIARAQEARKQALAKGSPLAMSILAQGLPLAAAAVAPAPRASRPAQRTLSDAEIELMSNMLAGGGNG